MTNALGFYSSIQPTYEELKRFMFLPPSPGHCRIQPTYEELKLGKVQLALLQGSRIQPTYEELKRITSIPLIFLSILVSSLPMRN